MRFSKEDDPPRRHREAREEVRACFCIGPQPGHSLCPCMERQERAADRELRELREEVRDLRRRLGMGFGSRETARQRQRRGGIGP